MAAAQGGQAGGAARPDRRAAQGHVRVRLPPEEDALLPGRGPGTPAHLRRVPGAPAPVADALGPRLRPGLQPLDPRAQARPPLRRGAAARRDLRVPEGRHRLDGHRRGARLHLLPRHQAGGADDALGGGPAHPRDHPGDDARRHGLRRRDHRPAPQVRGAAVRRRRGALRPRPGPGGAVRRGTGRGRGAPLARVPQPGGLARGRHPRRRRSGEPGGPGDDRVLDPRHAGDGVPEPPAALEALPHSGGRSGAAAGFRSWRAAPTRSARW